MCLEIRSGALHCTLLMQLLRWHLLLHLPAPMAMLGNGLNELRRHIIHPSVTAHDEPFIHYHLISLGIVLGNRHSIEIRRAQELNAGASGGNRFTMLVCLMNKVKGLILTSQHLNTLVPTRHIDSIEHDRAGGEQTEVN